jgi:Flp pilus assembly pilin Flp
MTTVPPQSNTSLIAAGISVAIIAIVPTIGTKLNTAFTKVSTAQN